MIRLEDEEFNVRAARPGILAWSCICAAAYAFITAIGYWTEMVVMQLPNSTGYDDVDGQARERVLRFVDAINNFDAIGIACFVVAFLLSTYAMGRLHFLSRKYSYSRTFTALSSILAYLALIPLVMQTQQIVDFLVRQIFNSLESLLAQFVSTTHIGFYGSLTAISAGGAIAFAVCFLLVAFFTLRWSLFTEPSVKRFSEGLIISLSPWNILWGARLVHWSDIRKASISRTKDKKDVLVLQTKAFTYKLRWDVLEKHFDPTEFMNELRSKCLPEVLDDSLSLREELKHDASTYTELWLKYFSASSRARSGQLAVGEKLHADKYEIAGELGAGGQGTAYLASMTELATNEQSTVVLKEYILPVHRGDSIFQQSMLKLQHEAEILNRIKHPHIVRLIDTFVEDHRGYLVMEYVEGRTLKQIVQSEGRQSESVVIGLALQICEILEHLHSMQPSIIHRDLTPDNLILQPDGKLKLVDFNVAHKLDSSATATVVGKHAYLPPEQFRGKPTEQSDIYAFGGTLFYLLTGQDPPPLSSSHPRKLVESVSVRLNEVVAKATALDLAKRTGSAKLMREELLRFEGASEAAARLSFDITKDDPNRKDSSDLVFGAVISSSTVASGNGNSERDNDAVGISIESATDASILTQNEADAAVVITVKEEEVIER